MKNISREIIVGLTALITILIFIWLFSFLKGNNLFSNTDRYYAVFNDIGGLEESAPVEINGYKAGIVKNIRFINDGSGRLLVTLSINGGYKLPESTIAEVTPETILAGMKIRLLIGATNAYHDIGDTLISRLDMGVISNLGDELKPVIRKADNIISDIDTLLNDLKTIITDDFKKDIRESSKNISNATYKLDTLLERSGDNISSLIYNLDSFSSLLQENSQIMDTTISQLSEITSELSESDLKASVNNFNNAIKETTAMLNKLNKGKGSAGLLLNDDSLYTNLTLSLEQLNLLLEDLKTNPERYVNISVFGRKKKK